MFFTCHDIQDLQHFDHTHTYINTHIGSPANYATYPLVSKLCQCNNFREVEQAISSGHGKKKKIQDLQEQLSGKLVVSNSDIIQCLT